MPGRKCLVPKLCLLSALVLLAWVLVAPGRKPGVVAVSPRFDCHRSHFALPWAEPTVHLQAGMASDAGLAGDALACEDEEQDRVEALNERPSLFLITCPFRKVPAHPVFSPRPFLSHYPIRC